MSGRWSCMSAQMFRIHCNFQVRVNVCPDVLGPLLNTVRPSLPFSHPPPCSCETNFTEEAFPIRVVKERADSCVSVIMFWSLVWCYPLRGRTVGDLPASYLTPSHTHAFGKVYVHMHTTLGKWEAACYSTPRHCPCVFMRLPSVFKCISHMPMHFWCSSHEKLQICPVNCCTDLKTWCHSDSTFTLSPKEKQNTNITPNLFFLITDPKCWVCLYSGPPNFYFNYYIFFFVLDLSENHCGPLCCSQSVFQDIF